MHDLSKLGVAELEAHAEELKDKISSLNNRAAGRVFTDSERDQWHEFNAEYDDTEKVLLDKRARIRRIERLSRDARHVEHADGDDAYAYRAGVYPSNVHQPQHRYQALRCIDHLSNAGEIPEHGILRLDEVVRRDTSGQDARYIAAAADDAYRSAWRKYVQHGRDSFYTDREREAVSEVQAAQLARAASLTDAYGGYAVPVQLDPTVVATSDGSLNPFRQISRVETITTNEMRFVTSDGITASYTAEAASATDGAPTLAAPVAYTEKAQAWVPFSIEVGEDWVAFETEIAKMLRDAKDVLEVDRFVSGLGHSSHEPEGLLVGATRALNTSATATLGVADVYSIVEELPARFRARASVVASPVVFNATRRLVGPGSTEPPVWSDGPPARMLRMGAYDVSSMSDTISVSGSTIMTVGDFSNFLVLDRVGAQVELVRHVLSGGVPTGQRGFYLYFRSSSKVLTDSAFRSLVSL